MSRGRLLPSVAVGVVFVLFGLLLAAGADAAPDVRAARSAELADVVDQRQREVAALDADARELRSGLDEGNRRLAESDAAIQAERSAGDAVLGAAGLTAVAGPGLTVELDDAPAPPPGEPLPPGVGFDDLVVHQQDLQSVVNALWAGGAEAIAVMDQRLIATSAVRCVGNTLILGGQVYSPPYRVQAVGDVTRMRTTLDTDPAVGVYREWADLVGLGFRISEGEAELPGYDGPLTLQHAVAAS